MDRHQDHTVPRYIHCSSSAGRGNALRCGGGLVAAYNRIARRIALRPTIPNGNLSVVAAFWYGLAVRIGQNHRARYARAQSAQIKFGQLRRVRWIYEVEIIARLECLQKCPKRIRL